MEDKCDTSVPEGGWGWVVVACSFLSHVLTVGVMFSLGVLYVSWLQDFGESKGLTSWVVSIGVAFMFGIGPVPSSLMTRFGSRAVQVTGSLLACAGFALSSLVTSVHLLILTAGVIGGTGLGFCYLPAVTLVAEYFQKRRAMAYGIATAGVGIGSFILAPFINWLETMYGWRGTLLILGGILLHLNVSAMFLKPLADSRRSRKNPCDLEVVVEEAGMNAGSDSVGLVTNNGEVGRVIIVEGQNQNVISTISGDGRYNTELKASVDLAEVALEAVHKQLSNNGSNSQIPEHSSSLRPFNKLLDVDHSFSSGERPRVGGSSQHIYERAPSAEANKRQCSSVSELRRSSQSGFVWNSAGRDSEDGSRKGSFRNLDIMLCGSIHSLHIIHEKHASKNSLQYDSLLYKQPVDENETESLVEQPAVMNATPKRNVVVRTLVSLVEHFSLLKDKVFFSLAMSNLLTNLSFLMPVLFMVDRAVEAGIDKPSAAILVSINGVGNVLGRILFGVLADCPCVDSVVLYIITLTVCGAGTSISPVCGESLVLHGIYSAFFGCFMGGYVSLAPVVTVELMGVARVGQAYGILLFFMGVGGAVGPPLAGWVYDWTGGFTTAFIIHGIWICLSAAILIPVTAARLCRQRRETR